VGVCPVSVEDLVQVGYEQWVDPKTIVRVLHWPSRPSRFYDDGMSTDNTVLVHDSDNVTISYWPFPRIQKVLGLHDTTWIHQIWEDGEPVDRPNSD
jgi:hypothetical protein